MADTRWLLSESFNQRFEQLLKQHPSLDRLTEEEALRLGREAADAIAGPVIWRDLLGEDRLDTTNVAMLLGITRQAVHKKVKTHALFGVAGRGTTWFPSWQFDIPNSTCAMLSRRCLRSGPKLAPMAQTSGIPSHCCRGRAHLNRNWASRPQRSGSPRPRRTSPSWTRRIVPPRRCRREDAAATRRP